MKPINMKTWEVQALLDGRKNTTRRVVKPQPICHGPNITFEPHDEDFFLSAEKGWLRCRVCGHDPEYSREGSDVDHHWEPPYHPGDILYVRETWTSLVGSYLYKADQRPNMTNPGKWQPSIHMPKEAARLFLRVTDVRVERLQNMTEEDVCAEGAEELIMCQREHTIYYPEGGMEACWNVLKCTNCPIYKTYQELFGERVWDVTLNRKDRPLYGWDANPFCWVIEFERVSREVAKR